VVAGILDVAAVLLEGGGVDDRAMKL